MLFFAVFGKNRWFFAHNSISILYEKSKQSQWISLVMLQKNTLT